MYQTAQPDVSGNAKTMLAHHDRETQTEDRNHAQVAIELLLVAHLLEGVRLSVDRLDLHDVSLLLEGCLLHRCRVAVESGDQAGMSARGCLFVVD